MPTDTGTDRTEPVLHTRAGFTARLTPKPEKIRAPFDLDRTVARGLTVVTTGAVLGAMAWSTTSIGGLLHRMAPSWVSYTVALTFDAAWAACMGAEYLMRYDRRRVWLPRLAGVLFLLVSMSVIIEAARLTSHDWVIGAAGAAVALLAKGLWTVVMTISAHKLSPEDQEWFMQAESALHAEMGVTAIQRRLLRQQARVMQERAALSRFGPVGAIGQAPSLTVLSGQTDTALGGDGRTRSAGQGQPRTDRRAAPGQTGGRLPDSGQFQGQTDTSVSAPVSREIPGQTTDGGRTPDIGQGDGNMHSIGQPTALAQLVRDTVSDGMTDSEIRAFVFDQRPTTDPDTLTKTIKRARDRAARNARTA